MIFRKCRHVVDKETNISKWFYILIKYLFMRVYFERHAEIWINIFLIKIFKNNCVIYDIIIFKNNVNIFYCISMVSVINANLFYSPYKKEQSSEIKKKCFWAITLSSLIEKSLIQSMDLAFGFYFYFCWCNNLYVYQ